MNAIDIVGLCKIYTRNRKKAVEALKNLTFNVGEGEIIGFLGPNGAGKSTTIKSIMGQVTPTAGSIEIFGIPVTDTASRQRIGYLPENPAFYDFLTAREYLRVVGRAFALSSKDIEKSIGRVIDIMDLAGAADRHIRGYSKGMIQRLGLAQAMLHDPDLYILDEPMSGLDPLGRALVKDLIKDLKARGKTVFFSTHITADIEVVCDRVGLIVHGELRALDSVKNILHQGIIGYSIQISGPDGAIQEKDVVADNLEAFLRQVLASGEKIERIEPKRKDVEGYFLDVVSESTTGSE